MVIATLAGALFGSGLVVSELSNPNKVLNFLDIAGQWDPSLVIVMAVAAGFTALGFRLAWRLKAPVCADAFHVPSSKVIDGKLVAGAVMFGVGWGISGYCPGPSITALVINPGEGLPFVAALVVGGLLHRFVSRT